MSPLRVYQVLCTAQDGYPLGSPAGAESLCAITGATPRHRRRLIAIGPANWSATSNGSVSNSPLPFFMQRPSLTNSAGESPSDTRTTSERISSSAVWHFWVGWKRRHHLGRRFGTPWSCLSLFSANTFQSEALEPPGNLKIMSCCCTLGEWRTCTLKFLLVHWLNFPLVHFSHRLEWFLDQVALA